MMRRVVGWVLLPVLAGGCEGVGDDPDIEVVAASAGATELGAALAFFEPFPAFCSSRRTVAYNPAGGCPAVAGWSRSDLFPSASESELKRYCVYSFLGAGEPTQAQVNLARPPNGQIHPDCLVVAPAAGDWPELFGAFGEQIDPPALAHAPPPAPLPGRTWLAMIDSSPGSPSGNGEAAQGNDPHGYVLGRIARLVGCPSGGLPGQPCVVRLHNELALPQAFDGVRWHRPANGGHFGYQSELAVAIHRAVNAWRSGQPGQNDHLVLNLSVGWLAAFGGPVGDSTLEKTPARAVLASIQKAVCRGAVVFAAAGNWSGGSAYTDGPIYPAGWTHEARPTPARCKVFGGVWPPYNSGGQLLEAVGGVDGRDQPLSIGRDGSTPRMVAPAVRGTAVDIANPPLRWMTGTSVATAVASTAAAVAWAYAPELDSKQIVEMVYTSGPLLDRLSDSGMCIGSERCPVRRVSICGALERACADPAGGRRARCTPITCADRPAGVDARPRVMPGMLRPPDTFIDVSGMVPLVGVTPAQCGPTTALFRPAGSVGPGDAPCPDRQFHSGVARAGVGPQPNDSGCPTCYSQLVGPRLSLHVELDASVIPLPLVNPSLTVVTAAGKFRHALWEFAGGLSLGEGHVYLISIPRPIEPIVSVHLSGVTARGEAWQAQIEELADP